MYSKKSLTISESNAFCRAEGYRFLTRQCPLQCFKDYTLFLAQWNNGRPLACKEPGSQPDRTYLGSHKALCAVQRSGFALWAAPGCSGRLAGSRHAGDMCNFVSRASWITRARDRAPGDSLNFSCDKLIILIKFNTHIFCFH